MGKTITLQPLGVRFVLQPHERILEAASRLGFRAPKACRNGICHICTAQLVRGQVRQQGQVLSGGEIFPCLAEPLADCTLHWENVLAPGQLPRRQLACQVTDMRALGGEVVRLLLRAPAGKRLDYHAGQYLRMARDDGQHSAFSIASHPQMGRVLELHILKREASAQQLLAQLLREGIAHVELPFGEAHLAQLPQRPLLLIAAGTGMAQMQSLLQDARQRGFAQPVWLYWGARKAADFYQLAHWQDWQQQARWQLQQIVSEDESWAGRRGLLHQAVCSDLRGQLAGVQCHISGSPEMVWATCDALLAAGMEESQMHADVFSYAPRAAAP